MGDYEPVEGKSGQLATMAAWDFIEEFADHYVSEKRAKAGKFPEDRSNIGRGLMFCGRNGTRKTTLATSILTELQYRSKSFSYYGFYIRFSEWQRCLTDTFSKDVTPRVLEAMEMLEKANTAPLVVLDDLGQEYRTATGFTSDKFHELVRVRYESALPTIITTNIEPEQLEAIYGKSFESFRHDAFDTFEIMGKDTRKLERN
jgi:DNA replication protein DnaC